MARNALTSNDFLKELELYAEEQRLLIESECDAFSANPKAKAVRIKRTQDDFEFFCNTYFPHYILSEKSAFHEFVFNVIPKHIDDEKGHNDAIAAPRGEAKSTLITQLLNLWCIITGRKKFEVIIMDAFDQAAMMLEAIKAELEYNPRLRMDYPDIAGPGRIWRAGVIVTKNNIKVQVAGSGKKVRGWRHGPHRPDLVTLDDIENDENVRKKEQRDKTHTWVKKAVMKLGPPDGSMDIIYIGTILHYDSVLNRTMKSPMWHGKRFQAIMRWPDNMDLWDKWEEILINEDESVAEFVADQYYQQNQKAMDLGAVVSWPSTRPLLMLMKIRADDHHSFDSEMQNDPSNSEDAPFKGLQYWVHRSRDWVFYGACDPSMGKKNKSRDPSAIGVGGYDRNTGTLDVVEAKVARRVPDKIISDIIALQEEYKCILWAFESVVFSEFMRTELLKRSVQAGIPVPARAVTPLTDKDLRIESLQPYIAAGLIRSHRDHKTFNDQLIHYPEADHDDGPDMLEMLWKLSTSGAGGVPVIRSGKQKIRDFINRAFSDG
jgi:predicted phage terminase large subunit-like protein